MTDVYHWMRWEVKEGGLTEAYPACGVPLTYQQKGYTVYTDQVTCEVCKLWLLVNQMSR